MHGKETNSILFIIRTGAHEFFYPVWDREDKNHTLSSDTSLYRPYKGVSHPSPPPHHLPSGKVFGADFLQCVIKGAKDNTSDNHYRLPTDCWKRIFLGMMQLCFNQHLNYFVIQFRCEFLLAGIDWFHEWMQFWVNFYTWRTNTGDLS